MTLLFVSPGSSHPCQTRYLPNRDFESDPRDWPATTFPHRCAVDRDFLCFCMYTLKERVGDDIIMKQKLISDALSPPAPPPLDDGFSSNWRPRKSNISISTLIRSIYGSSTGASQSCNSPDKNTLIFSSTPHWTAHPTLTLFMQWHPSGQDVIHLFVPTHLSKHSLNFTSDDAVGGTVQSWNFTWPRSTPQAVAQRRLVSLRQWQPSGKDVMQNVSETQAS